MIDSRTTATSTATGTVRDAVGERLDRAREHLVAADRVLTARAPDPAVLHAAVDGAIRLANALADLVTSVMRQAPAGHDLSAQPNSDDPTSDGFISGDRGHRLAWNMHRGNASRSKALFDMMNQFYFR